MHRMLIGAALWVVPATASAFCGTYVGQAGAGLYNNASQVAISRQGERTTLTLANEFEGDLAEFALVVPVPQVLGPDDVTVVEGELIARLDAYSAPRLVKYTCDDFRYYDSSDYSPSSGDSGGVWDTGDTGGVVVEATFTAGEYEIVVLSAQESGALLGWLDANGYAINAAAADLLQEYIDGGSYFFAAKVALDQAGTANLRPLQFSYDAEVFSLPVRLGTLNSQGQQDLLIYVVNEHDAGQTGIANYTPVDIEDECMIDLPDQGSGDDFLDFYGEQIDRPLVGLDRAGWALEYGWTPAKCDPCSGDPLTDEDIQGLGFEGGAADAYFSRLHLRYAPGQVDQDLSLYSSNDTATTQLRYILYDAQLEDRFPVCGVGMVENPGTCDDDTTDTDGTDTDAEAPTDEETGACGGCAASAAPGTLALWLGLVGLAVRRRR